MNNKFHVFHSPKPQNRVRILIFRNWLNLLKSAYEMKNNFAYFKSLSKDRRMAFFFLKYLFSF